MINLYINRNENDCDDYPYILNGDNFQLKLTKLILAPSDGYDSKRPVRIFDNIGNYINLTSKEAINLVMQYAVIIAKDNHIERHSSVRSTWIFTTCSDDRAKPFIPSKEHFIDTIHDMFGEGFIKPKDDPETEKTFVDERVLPSSLTIAKKGFNVLKMLKTKNIMDIIHKEPVIFGNMDQKLHNSLVKNVYGSPKELLYGSLKELKEEIANVAILAYSASSLANTKIRNIPYSPLNSPLPGDRYPSVEKIALQGFDAVKHLLPHEIEVIIVQNDDTFRDINLGDPLFSTNLDIIKKDMVYTAIDVKSLENKNLAV
jgi:hypothetical protein